MKAAAYIRVDQGGSDEIQRDSMEMQRRQIDMYASSQDIKITGYYEDMGYPGNDLGRPGLTQMIHDCEKGLFEDVIVLNSDRLYRGSLPCKWPFQVITAFDREPDMPCRTAFYCRVATKDQIDT